MKTKAEKTEFVKYLAALASTFSRECDQAMQTGYWIGLKDLELTAFKKGVEVSMRACKFMPTVADLREFAGEMRIEDRAQLAFASLSLGRQRFGYYRSVNFDDRAINAAVRALGGWETVCGTDEKEWNSFFRKRFIDTYSAYCRTGVGKEAGAALPGYYDRENAITGHKSPNPTVQFKTGLPALPRVTSEKFEAAKVGNGQAKQIGEIVSPA